MQQTWHFLLLQGRKPVGGGLAQHFGKGKHSASKPPVCPRGAPGLLPCAHPQLCEHLVQAAGSFLGCQASPGHCSGAAIIGEQLQNSTRDILAAKAPWRSSTRTSDILIRRMSSLASTTWALRSRLQLLNSLNHVHLIAFSSTRPT